VGRLCSWVRFLARRLGAPAGWLGAPPGWRPGSAALDAGAIGG